MLLKYTSSKNCLACFENQIDRIKNSSDEKQKQDKEAEFWSVTPPPVLPLHSVFFGRGKHTLHQSEAMNLVLVKLKIYRSNNY